MTTIAYHGSAVKIASFDMNRAIGIADPNYRGLFFSTNKKVALRYAQMAVKMRRGKAPFVTTVKLTLKNPALNAKLNLKDARSQNIDALILDVSSGQDIAVADASSVEIMSSEPVDAKWTAISQ